MDEQSEALAAFCRREHPRLVGALTAVLLIVAAGLIVPRLFSPQVEFADTAERHTYPVPDRGEAAPQWLADGTPIFVVHGLDGGVWAVRAVGRYTDGIDTAVVWCPPARRFSTEWTASMFKADGSWVGGPDPHGLVTYQTALTEDGQVRVGSALSPQPRSTDTDTTSGPGCWGNDGMLDRDVAIDHGWADSPALRPDEVADVEPGQPVLARGLYVLELDGTSWLCAELVQQAPPTCGGRGLRLTDDREPRDWASALEVVMRGRWRDGRFHDALLGAALAEVTSYDRRGEQREVAEASTPPDNIRAVDGRLIVPAGDIWFGVPAGAVTAATYEVLLDNHGAIRHTLNLQQDPSWQLAAEGGQRAVGTLRLDPGAYQFFCTLPGHREAGMEFTLEVR